MYMLKALSNYLQDEDRQPNSDLDNLWMYKVLKNNLRLWVVYDWYTDLKQIIRGKKINFFCQTFLVKDISLLLWLQSREVNWYDKIGFSITFHIIEDKQWRQK